MTYTYEHISGRIVSLCLVNLALDFDTLYEWCHKPHVIPNWQLNKSYKELYQHFRKAIENRYQSIFMVAVDKNIICYAEIYHAMNDRLANFTQVSPNDYGLHLFIGPEAALGKKHSEAILCGLTDYAFTIKHAHRVLVEPNQNVKQLTILERKLFFSEIAKIKFPEKIATLYAIEAQQFYQQHSKHIGFARDDHATICYEIIDWPLLHIHFPNFPNDEAVKAWLREMDKLLFKKNKFVIITTFAKHYQFTPSARRYQALWFKRNTQLLATYCLGMVRVTQDQDMIAKITSNAMRKGMPFLCIPAKSVFQAKKVAQQLFKNSEKSAKLLDVD